MSEHVFPVPPAISTAAHVDAARYEAMRAEAASNPDAFWRREAQRVDWIKPFTTVDNSSFHESDFGIRWFEDGVLTATFTIEDMVRALEESRDHPQIMRDLRSGDFDSIYGDYVIQQAIFGEVIFG